MGIVRLAVIEDLLLLVERIPSTKVLQAAQGYQALASMGTLLLVDLEVEKLVEYYESFCVPDLRVTLCCFTGREMSTYLTRIFD